jgi:hypothetical protein
MQATPSLNSTVRVLSFDTIETLIGQADAVQIVFEEVQGPIRIGDGQVTKPTKVIPGRSVFPIEDPKFRAGLVPVLRPMQLSASSMCLCFGHPSLEFLKEKTVIMTLCVRHDGVVLIDTAKGWFVVKGYAGLTDKFYGYLHPFLPKREGKVQEFSVAAQHKSEIDEARDALKKDVKHTEHELQDSVRNQELEITPPQIEIPKKK